MPFRLKASRSRTKLKSFFSRLTPFCIRTRRSQSLQAAIDVDLNSLQTAIDVDLNALVHDLHESGIVLLADNERVRISGLACSKGRQLVGKSIHDRMVLQFNVDLHLPGPLLEVLEGMQEDPHLVRRSLREHSTSDDSDHVALAAIFYGEDESEGSRRVPGDENRGYLPVAEKNRLSVGDEHIDARGNGLRPLGGRRSKLHEVPIGGGHIHVRAVMLLQIWCAAEVVGVAVRDDHDLHVRRIEAE